MGVLIVSKKPTAEMREACLNITLQMRLIMMPFVAPFVRAVEDGAIPVGSGGFGADQRSRCTGRETPPHSQVL
jgi:hypothetical protein